MERQEVRFDFSKLDRSGMSTDCPLCDYTNKFGNAGIGVGVHPEMISTLCDKHYKVFRKWHDKKVGLGNIKSWFKEV